MGIISQYTYWDGKYQRVWWEEPDGDVIQVKFLSPSGATVEEMTDRVNDERDNRDYGFYEQLDLSVVVDTALIVSFIQNVKANPSLNLTQYNNYLNSLSWSDSSQIRAFVFLLATKLAEINEVNLPDLTETQVLSNLRDWIVNTPVRKLEKLVFGIFKVA